MAPTVPRLTAAVFERRLVAAPEALLVRPLLEDGPGDLRHDAGAIARLAIVVAAAAVVVALECRQALPEDVVTDLALDVGDEANATGVLLLGRIVQTLLRGKAKL